ncbi:MAG: hypothetical protein LBV12_08170 [Puniceicoccales bacterium]|jgi:hypothetical protein|nr:hypothetical protein [Puniceicoccales bacterium]
MIKLGIENPVTGNDYIHSYSLDLDRMLLNQPLGDNIFRCSASCDNFNELKQEVPLTVQKISKKLNLLCVIVTGWKEQDATRTKLLNHYYQAKGFRLESEDGYRIAISAPFIEIDDFKLKEFLGASSYLVWGGAELGLGNSLGALKMLIISSARSFAAPDKSAMNIFQHDVRAFSYVLRSDDIRPGFVILSEDERLFEEPKIIFGSSNIGVGDASYIWRKSSERGAGV